MKHTSKAFVDVNFLVYLYIIIIKINLLVQYYLTHKYLYLLDLQLTMNSCIFISFVNVNND